MGALIATILSTPGLTSVIGAITDQGSRRLSKAKTGAVGMLAVAPEWSTLIPAAFSGDAGAIGTLVGILITFGITLWGRGNKG